MDPDHSFIYFGNSDIPSVNMYGFKSLFNVPTEEKEIFILSRCVSKHFQIVQEYERAVIFRLGRILPGNRRLVVVFQLRQTLFFFRLT